MSLSNRTDIRYSKDWQGTLGWRMKLTGDVTGLILEVKYFIRK